MRGIKQHCELLLVHVPITLWVPKPIYPLLYPISVLIGGGAKEWVGQCLFGCVKTKRLGMLWVYGGGVVVERNGLLMVFLIFELLAKRMLQRSAFGDNIKIALANI